jgi:hypothetical protein
MEFKKQVENQYPFQVVKGNLVDGSFYVCYAAFLLGIGFTLWKYSDMASLFPGATPIALAFKVSLVLAIIIVMLLAFLYAASFLISAAIVAVKRSKLIQFRKVIK